MFSHCACLLALFLALSALTHAAGVPPSVDVVIYGATPGGIVTAVRAAREGLRVALVHHHAHIGGMLSNGLGVFDTMFDGKRAPLYDDTLATQVSDLGLCYLYYGGSGASVTNGTLTVQVAATGIARFALPV